MLGSATAYVTHGTYFLQHADRLPPTPDLAGQSGIRLLFPDTSGAGGLCVVTGTFDGPVDLIVETCDGAPADTPDDEWEHVEELALHAAGHDLVVTTLSGLVETLPALALAPGDRYRHTRTGTPGRPG